MCFSGKATQLNRHIKINLTLVHPIKLFYGNEPWQKFGIQQYESHGEFHLAIKKQIIFG